MVSSEAGWAGFGSSLATLMFFWATAGHLFSFLPLQRLISRINSLFFPEVQITIHERGREWYYRNKVYSAVETYLAATTAGKANKLRAGIDNSGKNIALSMDDYEEVYDTFQGITVKWGYICKPVNRGARSSYGKQDEKRFYTLTFHRRHRALMVGSYLNHVMETSRVINSRNRQRKLYTNAGESSSSWSDVVFNHPATFDTLALDPKKKETIMEDLLTFSKSKDYYAKIGKAWKRGYLLYGPPGTGKSTMIAAIANFLDYDIYDLELTAVKSNTELRKLLTETTSKSLVVLEDIDCSIDLTGERERKKKEGDETSDGKEKTKRSKKETSRVTLSGLLNFIDGLWSSCGGERIIVFTTNHVEKLDPALIRRGRMDMHIEMSYCEFEAFKVLAKNYLDLDSHPLFDRIRSLLEVSKMTPADVAEKLMPKHTNAEVHKVTGYLEDLVRALEEVSGKR